MSFAIHLAFCLLLSSVSIAASAQSPAAVFARELKQLRQAYPVEPDSLADIDDVNPLYYRLLGPATFYSSALDKTFSLNDSTDASDQEQQLKDAIDAAMVHAYATQPRAIHRFDAQFADAELTEEQSQSKSVSEDINKVLAEALKGGKLEPAFDEIDDIGLHITRPNFWKKSGKFSLQFAQNYFSENWYRGGNNTQNLKASITLNANYNDQRHISWTNRLILQLGFITSPSDSIHNYLTQDDKINLYTKFGVKAANNWEYTTTAEANTQFMKSYRANNRRKYANFLSPLDFYLSIGMDYKPTLKNGNKLSVALLPLSYKIRYVQDDDENIHKVLSMVNCDFKQDWGSKIEVNATYTLAKNLKWTCRAYGYTSYEYVEAELENTFSFSFNKYLSAELYTLWRFDDNRPRQYYDDNLGYFQFKENFTFGLTYSF